MSLKILIERRGMRIVVSSEMEEIVIIVPTTVVIVHIGMVISHTGLITETRVKKTSRFCKIAPIMWYNSIIKIKEYHKLRESPHGQTSQTN
jgi:hypothetical protein